MNAELPELIRRFLPTPRLIAWEAPMALLYTVAAVWLVSHLRCRRHVGAPYTRKIFHFLIFTMAGALQVFVGLPGVVVFGSIVSAAVLWAIYRGDDFPFYEAMARPSDRPQRTLFILVPFLTTALGGILGNLFFPRVAYVGYLVVGWGDALGEPVGTRWGKHRYRVPSLAGVPATRSLEGSTAVFLGGCLAAFAGLHFAGIHLPLAVYVALGAGLAGAVAEAFSTHGLDNLTVQLAAAAVAFLVLPS
jgi:phytol kinase